MKTKSEILKVYHTAICKEDKYRALRLEIEVDKRDEMYYTRGEMECQTKELKSIHKLLNDLKEEQSCDKVTK